MTILANILDPVRRTLAPKIWDSPGSKKPVLKQEIQDWIQESVHKALEENGYGDHEDWLSLVLTGSICTYQYSEASDLDVSLFVDTEKLPEWSRADMIGIMTQHCDGKKFKSLPYPLQAYVVPSGVTREDLYKPGLRSGYELETRKWISPPERARSKDVKKTQPEDYAQALEAVDKMQLLLRYEPDKAKQYFDQIHRRRRNDQKAGKGDYAASNVIYKALFTWGLEDQIEAVTGEHLASAPKQSSRIFDHYNPRTGLPCDCTWGARRHNRRKSSIEMRKLEKQNQKVFRSDEGKEYLDSLKHLVTTNPDAEPLVPWLASRFKHGDIEARPHPNSPDSDPEKRLYHGYTPVASVLPQWLQWANARQHPLRRGQNIMSMDANQLNETSAQLRREVQEKQKAQNWLSEHGQTGVPVHTFDKSHPLIPGGETIDPKYHGWTIRQLKDAQDCEAESDALGHCIGQDDQPYKNNIVNENIDAYSLRDKAGYPKATWHFNEDGSLAHLQGASGDPKQGYRDLISHFHDRKGLDDDEGGSGSEHALEGEDEEDLAHHWTVSGADDPEEYLNHHHPEGDGYWDQAYEEASDAGQELAEDADVGVDEPNWPNIVNGLTGLSPQDRNHVYQTALTNSWNRRGTPEGHQVGLGEEIQAQHQSIHNPANGHYDHHEDKQGIQTVKDEWERAQQGSFNGQGQQVSPDWNWKQNATQDTYRTNQFPHGTWTTMQDKIQTRIPYAEHPDNPGVFAREKLAAETKTQLLRRAEGLPQDTSRIVHTYPDGWTVRRLNTYGDMHREGQLMGNCFSPTSKSSDSFVHREWKDHPEVNSDLSILPESRLQGMNLGHPVSRDYYSLRTPENLPKVSIDPEAPEPALGRHNQNPREEYMDRIHTWNPSMANQDQYGGFEEEEPGFMYSKTSMAVPLYHVAPASAREDIQKNGLMGHDFNKVNSPWTQDLGQPAGNYFWDDPEAAHGYAYTVQGQRSRKYEDYHQFPGDHPEDFQMEGVNPYAGGATVLGEPEEGYEDEPSEEEYDHQNPAHRDLLKYSPHLQGYDIWHVPEHGLQDVRRDPENSYAQGMSGPGMTLDEARGVTDEHIKKYDDPNYEGSGAMRYYTPEHVPPERLNLHEHIPAHQMTEENSYNTLEGGAKEYPEPYHHVPIKDWAAYKPPQHGEWDQWDQHESKKVSSWEF